MKGHLKQHPYFSLICALLLIGMCIMSVAAIRRQQERPQLPRIVSRVRNIEVVNATIRGPMVAIEIRNNSDKPVIALTVEFRDNVDAAGVNHNGFNDGDEAPSVVIEPYGTITVEIPLSYANHVRPGSPIRIGGVMYADDSAEGDEATLRTMRGQREHYRARRRGQSRQQ
jgi:hypothetical protein